MVCYHQGRYGVEVKIESLFVDKICSWVRNVSGINKYVTDMSMQRVIVCVDHSEFGIMVFGIPTIMFEA